MKYYSKSKQIKIIKAVIKLYDTYVEETFDCSRTCGVRGLVDQHGLCDTIVSIYKNPIPIDRLVIGFKL